MFGSDTRFAREHARISVKPRISEGASEQAFSDTRSHLIGLLWRVGPLGFLLELLEPGSHEVSF